jgi:hypothetical protein
MKRIIISIFIIALAYSCLAQSRFDYVNVKEYGTLADGISDDTPAIQKALNDSPNKGGICFLPSGRYRLNGSLVVPEGVTLKGSYDGVPHPSHPIGTVLLIYGGKGNADAAPAITLKSNASVKNLIIHYPEQQAPPKVIPYPWTIQIEGVMCQVVDLAMTNPYQAIDAGSKWNELHLLRNIFACPLKIGIYVDQCTDVGRIENVHFNPNFWKNMGFEQTLPVPPAGYEGGKDKFRNDLLAPYLLENLVGFKIGRTDWEYISNSFVIFAKQGFLFDDFGFGESNALVTQSGSDIGPVAVQVNKVQKASGVQFTNCQFMSTVKIGPENTGPVKISNSGFWVVKDTYEQVIQEGTGTLILNACHFSDWDIPNAGRPCIRASNGRLIVSNCEFVRPWTGDIYSKKQAVLFEKDFISGTVTGSLFHNDTISNISKGKVELMANIIEDAASNIDLTKAKLIDICKMYEFKITDVLTILKSQGVKAEPDMSMEDIAKENKISAVDVFNILSSHLKDMK